MTQPCSQLLVSWLSCLLQMRLCRFSPMPLFRSIQTSGRNWRNLSGWPEPIISALLFLLVANLDFLFLFNSTSYLSFTSLAPKALILVCGSHLHYQLLSLTSVLHAPPTRWGTIITSALPLPGSITEQLQSHPLGNAFWDRLSSLSWHCSWVRFPAFCPVPTDECLLLGALRYLSVPADSWAASCNTNFIPVSRSHWCCDL